jgi:peptidyl-prolyl cis-trans isomerase A (cyclophilin A)
MPIRSTFAFIGLAAALLVACSGEPRSESASKAPSADTAAKTPSGVSTLENPSAEALAERAPDTVRVRFETSKGPFTVEAYRKWAPHGVDRFYQLVKMGYYDDVRFFRVINGFMAQFGLHGNPRVWAAWQNRVIPDDSVVQSNKRGTITFATRGPNTRTSQLFINYRDNSNLDGMGFTPFGVVKDGMKVVDSLYSGYGEGAPDGAGPSQDRAGSEGNEYMKRDFPKLDYVVKATLLTEPKRR